MEIKQAETKAKELLQKHNLLDWSFKYFNCKKVFGRCSYSRKTIFLSKPLTLLNNEQQVVDTILHEIAHSLVGRNVGHSYIWKTKAEEIGCNGNRCYGEEVITPKKKWCASCPSCKRIIFRHRRILTLACGKCCGKEYQDKYKFTWKENN